MKKIYFIFFASFIIMCNFGYSQLGVGLGTISNITDNGAKCESYGYGGAITKRGVCWGLNAYPDTVNCLGLTHDGTGSGTYFSYITGLQSGTTYYVRAYVVSSSNQLAYSSGNGSTFTTTGTVGIFDKNMGYDNILIYPNPCNNILNIQFEIQKPSEITISLYNYLNQQVIIETSDKYEGLFIREMNITDLSKGIYLLKIQIGETIFNKKIVIS